MNIIFIRKKTGRVLDLNVSRSFIAFVSLLFLSIPVMSYYWGVTSNNSVITLSSLTKTESVDSKQKESNQSISAIYKNELNAQQKEIERIKLYYQDNINALTLNLAKLQAHIIRLDSLGNRLTEVAELDKKSFNFDFEPAIGGAAEADEVFEDINYADFIKRMNEVTQDIDDKARQLDIIENLLVTENIKHSATPTGKPADSGWISSYFGLRKDPFTGKKKMHKGIDIAGKPGIDVLATADGVVIMVEKQKGYGKVLEIDHGYGISTRYGHNKTVAVKVGDVIKQGQMIATMGSTGRSTGPHIHYEVLRNGVQVNPHKYIITARKG